MKINRFGRSTNQFFMSTKSTALQGTGSALKANNQSSVKSAKGSNKLRIPMEKEFLMGTPSIISKDGMFVTLGGKHDGYCPLSDIGDAVVGEPALFRVVSSNNEDAMPTLSRTKAQLWEGITQLGQSGEPTFVKVLKVARNQKGNAVTGLSVVFESGATRGAVGHIPYWEISRGVDLNSLVGHVIAASVTEVAPHKGGKNGLVLLSHVKAFGENSSHAVSTIKVGEVVEAKVLKFITASKGDEHPSVLVCFTKAAGGANGDIEEYDQQATNTFHAMIHKSEVAGYPHKKATDIMKVGDTISAHVLRASTDKRTVVLGMRSEERAAFLAQIEPGHILAGKVARSLQFGYFIDFGFGIEGLLRIQELNRIGGKPEVCKIGSEIKVVVLQNDQAKNRLLLGRRELPAEFL